MAFLLSVLACSSTLAQTPPATQPSYTRRQDVVYGRVDGTALTLDVFKPTGDKNGAIVIWLVSGGWGSNHDIINPIFINSIVRPFTDRGYVVCAVVHGSQPRYTVPDIIPQIDRAVRYVRANAAQSGLDPNKIGIGGASAGGHLSLMMGTHPGPAYPKDADLVNRASSEVQAVACFFPPTDFLNWGEEGVNATKTPVGQLLAAPFDFKAFDQNAHKYLPVSEKRGLEILHDISPIEHVSAKSAPTLIIQGDADDVVPMQQAMIFIDKMKAAGAESELIIKPGGGHGWVPMGPELEKCADWFDAHLLGKTPVRAE